MKKSIIFLINGLGIEKPGSYSIAIDQCMPKLCRTKETSYYTSAVVNSLEYRGAYQDFFLGDTYNYELQYLKENVINNNISTNPNFQKLSQCIAIPNSKLHIFMEPTTERIVELINDLVSKFTLEDKKQIYLHFILPQQTTNDYQNLIDIVNYTKYHMGSHISVGFIIGKEYLSDELDKDEMNIMKKLLFYCSAERWSETEKKFNSLKEENIRPCVVQGFCTNNDCFIANGDTIMFCNTKKSNYDNIINSIYMNAVECLKTNQITLPMFSLLRLDSKYNIPCLTESIPYDNSLSNILERNNKNSLIITDKKNIQYVNFLANGYSHVNNKRIQFMESNYDYFSNQNNINQLLDNDNYNLYIFDYHMDVSKTVNDLKDQLTLLDNVIGCLSEACENKHTLFITSLYGLKKELPLADYNTEMVCINYEMMIPIFLFDYSYPQSKYTLAPGYTNDILNTALKCICDDNKLDSLIKEKGFVNNVLSAIKKNKN